MGARDWDAATYERVSDAQLEWGVEVLDRLPLRGDERALDAGCGSGRVTARLLERLPQGHVIAVDASRSMVERTRGLLGVEAHVADLTELVLDEPVDAIVSTAVFHWIADHSLLFERMHDALVPGGRMEAQCGGAGNIAELRRVVDELAREPPFDLHLGGWPGPWNFASPQATAARLQAAGFEHEECSLERKVLRTAEPRAFLASVSLGAHCDRLPHELRERFLESVIDRLEDPHEMEYVRLNISARRAQ
ncbi:MAG: hypothetical protein NVS2B6_17650 [Thermoleophilaceae bacterium]